MKFKSEGARLVDVLVKKFGAAEFGRRVETSEGMVRHIVAGRKTPGPDLRARIEAAVGVSASTWKMPPREDAPKKPAPAPPPADAPSKENGKVSGIAKLRATIELFDARIEDAKNEDTPTSAWVALLRGKADASDKLAKLQGEGELTIATVVRSRAWGDLMAALEPVLAEHPDVAAKIATALERLESA